MTSKKRLTGLKGTSTSTKKNNFKSQEMTVTVKSVQSIFKETVCIRNK